MASNNEQDHVEVKATEDINSNTRINATRVVAILGIAVKRAQKDNPKITDEAVIAYTSHQNDPNITLGDIRLAMNELGLE